MKTVDFNHLPAYELLRTEELKDIQSIGYLLRHRKSGARVMLLSNEDENKVFNIAFRTTPTDSTGVAHIMEHTVLCGSRSFPAKDPFVELVKGSMNTFLNAMTYPDKTMFPVASCNDADFANLMHVYLDAVFYPNIYKKKEIFLQEGWHYQLEDPEGEITYNGVVYNEMKGAYSSPEDVLERRIMNSLFPDNTYAFESGGDPERIPDLTYEDYLDFHRRYYHPSNSYIYLYGDMDFEERLIWLDQTYLSSFDEIMPHSEIALQEPFAQQRMVKCTYPISAEDSEEDNTYLSYNVVIGTSLDTKLASACAVLRYALLEMPGAPLKQALLEAGIGKDILSSYDSGIQQPVFSITAKNANAADADHFLTLIRQTLTEIADKGVEEKAILAAINTMEFSFREADYGTYPKGLIYGLDVFDSWLYDDAHPFDYLKQGDDFAYLKQQIGTGYYEALIRRYLLDNTHGSLLICEPKKGLTAQTEANVQHKLADYKASLSADQITELVTMNQVLRAYQETPSTPEELEMIPMLSRTDMRREIRPLRNHVQKESSALVISHNYSTNGIAYIQVLLDASRVAREDLPYLGILRSVLGVVNTEHYTYTELVNEINLNTGGITPGISLFANQGDEKCFKAALGMQARTLSDKIDFCFAMIEEMLFTSDLAQEKRLLEILQKLKSRTHTKLAEAGHATAAMRCQAQFSASAQFNDAISGIEFYRVVEELADHFEERKEELICRLRRVLMALTQGVTPIVSFTGSQADLDKARSGIAHLAQRLGAADAAQANIRQGVDVETAQTRDKEESVASDMDVDKALPDYPAMTFTSANEGFRTPGQVQYVSRCGSFKEGGYDYHGVLHVLRTIMSYDYLWNNIRVVGGAYGCGASFSRSGSVVFTSYRDPHLTRTNEVFEGVPAYMESFDCSDRDMTKYVIGAFSDLDTPLNPSALGGRDLACYLTGVSEKQLQKERDQVYNATQADIRALAPLVKSALDQNHLCVVGNEDKLNENKDRFDVLTNL